MITYFALVEGRDNSDFFGVIAIDGRLPKERAEGLVEQCEYGISEMSDLLTPVTSFVGFEYTPLCVVEIMAIKSIDSEKGDSSRMILRRESGEVLDHIPPSYSPSAVEDSIYQLFPKRKNGRLPRY